MALASRRGGERPALVLNLELAPVLLPQTGDDSHHAEAEQPNPQPLPVNKSDDDHESCQKQSSFSSRYGYHMWMG